MIRGIEQPTYQELLRQFPPRTITTEKAYEEALGEIDELLAKQKLSEAEQDFLSVLSTLVQVYEEQHYPIEELGARGIELVRGLIELHELSKDVLLPIFESPATLEETLRFERELTASEINQLALFFELPHSCFFENVTLSV